MDGWTDGSGEQKKDGRIEKGELEIRIDTPPLRRLNNKPGDYCSIVRKSPVS